MKKLLIIVALTLLVLGLVAFFLFRPVPYQIERSVLIDVPPEKSFGTIHDFNEWPKWSPWIVMEPEAKITVSGDGKSIGDVYSWAGEMVGKGELEHKAFDAPQKTEMEIRFIDPYFSKAELGFRVEPGSGAPGNSSVTMQMIGKVPSMMKKMMVAWVGMDFDRGLRMLKEYCETGKVVTNIEIPGEVDRPAMNYLGSGHDCKFSDISDSMGKAFDELRTKLDSIGIEPEGQFLSIYTDFDLVNNHVDYIAAYPLVSKPGTVPEGMVYDEIPVHRAFQVNHIGAVQNIGNGWSAGTMHLQKKKLKQSKSVMPYELMPVDVTGIPESEIRVEIFYPLR